MEFLRPNSNRLNRKINDFMKLKQVAPLNPPKSVRVAPETTEEKVSAYVRFLSSPFLVRALNDRITKKFHTRESSAALCDYYRRNPDLKSLTLSKEIPRMEYEFTVTGGKRLREAEEIKSFFRDYECDETDDLILRAANQALMADLLAVLVSGGVIKNEYLATAVAKKCAFFVNMDLRFKEERKFVKGVCDFVVSIPGGNDGRSRLRLATVRASAYFSPDSGKGSAPLLSYRVHGIQPHLDLEKDAHVIKTAAKWLAAHLHHEENATHHAPTSHSRAPKQQNSFDLGFSMPSFGKPNLDIASKVRSVIDTVAVIDQQTEAAETPSRGPRRTNSAPVVAEIPKAPIISGATPRDFAMEQLILEQRIILASYGGDVEARNDNEVRC